MDSYQIAYHFEMAFGLIYISLANEAKFAKKANNFGEIFSSLFKGAFIKKFNSTGHKIVS